MWQCPATCFFGELNSYMQFLSFNEQQKIIERTCQFPFEGYARAMEIAAERRPINDIFDAHVAAFANGKAIKRATMFSDEEYKRLVRITAHVNPDVLRYAKLDKSVEEWIADIPNLRVSHVPFEALSEEAYVKIVSQLCADKAFDGLLSTELSMENYTKIAEVAVMADSTRFALLKASRIERATYNKLALHAVLDEFYLLSDVDFKYIDNRTEFLLTVIKKHPIIASVGIDERLPGAEELLIESIKQCGKAIQYAPPKIMRQFIETAVMQTPEAIKSLSTTVFTPAECARLVKLAINANPLAPHWANHDFIPDDEYEELMLSAIDRAKKMPAKIQYDRFPITKHKATILENVKGAPYGIERLSDYDIDPAVYTEFAFAALSVDPLMSYAIRWDRILPDKLKELKLLGVQTQEKPFQWFDEHSDDELYEAALKHNGTALMFIPKTRITPKLIEIAVMRTPAMLAMCNAKEFGEGYAKLAAEACRIDAEALWMVDPAGMSSGEYEELCIAAVAADKANIKYVQYPLCRAEAYEQLLA